MHCCNQGFTVYFFRSSSFSRSSRSISAPAHAGQNTVTPVRMLPSLSPPTNTNEPKLARLHLLHRVIAISSNLYWRRLESNPLLVRIHTAPKHLVSQLGDRLLWRMMVRQMAIFVRIFHG